MHISKSILVAKSSVCPFSDQLKTVPISGDVGSTQEETVANFRCGGEVNLLVTTQSGLAAASSLPRCNLIASFQPSTSLTTYLAAKSRLRLVTAKSTKAHFWHFLEQDGISLRSRCVLDNIVFSFMVIG